MNWINYAIITFISCSIIIGLIRGFIKESLSIITWSCAFFIANKFYPYIAIYFSDFNNILIRNAVAIISLFISTLILGAIVNYIISTLIKRTGISSTDHILGACFGMLRGILIVSLILFILDTFNLLPKSKDWQYSKLISKFIYVIHWFLKIIK